MSRFTNRKTPPTDEDFACAPGILPGRRLPDHFYMDEGVETPAKAQVGHPTPAKAIKSPGIEPCARVATKTKRVEASLFDF
jgi:hypothetical protein